MVANEFVSVAQAAELLGITSQAVLKRIRTGRLQATKVGRNYIVAREAILPSAGRWRPGAWPRSSVASWPRTSPR